MTRLFLVVGFVCALAACGGGRTGERVLFDFESDSELNQFHWKCHTLFSLSNQHVTHGKGSLKLELYPSDYPGLVPILEEKDWSGHKSLCFDIYNPQRQDIQISLRIDDRKDYPGYGDGYNESFILKPGIHRLSLPLVTLVTSGTDRRLDLRRIHSLLIFVTRPESKVVLYFDYIRLV